MPFAYIECRPNKYLPAQDEYTSLQKWWVRWYCPGEDPEPTPPHCSIEWWQTGFVAEWESEAVAMSGVPGQMKGAVICAIVHGPTKSHVLDTVQESGWARVNELNLCTQVEVDWRPDPDRFPPGIQEG